MARARLRYTVSDVNGKRLVGAAVYVYEPNSSTPISETIYADETGVDTLANPLETDVNGAILFYLESPKRVDLKIVAAGYADLTVPDVGVMADPEDVALAAQFDTATGHDHDGTNSRQVDSADLSDAPSSCAALFNRTASGEFIQHATIGGIKTGTVGVNTLYRAASIVTFPVAFSEEPVVVPGGAVTDVHCIPSIHGVSTTGFTYDRWSNTQNEDAFTISWVAFGK
jgi:hypothetical protein